MKRSRRLAQSSIARVQSLARILESCSNRHRCGLPYCSRCRHKLQSWAKSQVQNYDASRCYALTVDVIALPLDAAPLKLGAMVKRIRNTIAKRLKRSGLQLRLFGGFEIAVKSRAGLLHLVYPVEDGPGSWFALLHIHAIVETDHPEQISALFKKMFRKLEVDKRVQLKSISEPTIEAAKGWAGYAFKVSLSGKSGIPAGVSNRIRNDLLSGIVATFESFRGQGSRGLRLTYNHHSGVQSVSTRVNHIRSQVGSGIL